MSSFFNQLLRKWLGSSKEKRVRRHLNEYEILQIVGRKQLERLKEKGLSIPVVTA